MGLKLQVGMILLAMESAKLLEQDEHRLQLNWQKYWALSICSHLKAFGVSVWKD